MSKDECCEYAIEDMEPYMDELDKARILFALLAVLLLGVVFVVTNPHAGH